MPAVTCSISRDSNFLRRLLLTSTFAILFIVVLSFVSSSAFLSPGYPFPLTSIFSSTTADIADPSPPSLAYFISGTEGDSNRLFRLLLAVYHPRNIYLLHLDLAASEEKRRSLAIAVQDFPLFKSVRNVHVIGKADFADPRGSSVLSSVLHGAAILLRLGQSWDWFINLEASDYPLVTQDGKYSDFEKWPFSLFSFFYFSSGFFLLSWNCPQLWVKLSVMFNNTKIYCLNLCYLSWNCRHPPHIFVHTERFELRSAFWSHWLDRVNFSYRWLWFTSI